MIYRSARFPEHLQHAFIAVEDHRCYAILASIPSHSAAPSSETCPRRNRRRWKHADPAVGAHAFLSTRRLPTKGEGSGPGDDDRWAADQTRCSSCISTAFISVPAWMASRRCSSPLRPAAKQLNPRSAALIAGLASAPSMCRRGRISMARLRAAMSSWRACARKIHHRVAGTRSAQDEALAWAVSGLQRFARRLCEGVPTPGFRERFGGNHPPNWEVTTFVPALQDRRNGRAQGVDGSTSPTSGGARRHRPRARQHPRARRRPGLLAVAVQPREPQPASTRFGVGAASSRRRSSTAIRRYRDRWVTTIEPQGPDEVVAAECRRETPDVLTLRAALPRVERWRRGTAPATARRIAARPAARLPRRPARHAGRAVLSLGTGVVTPSNSRPPMRFPNGGWR